MINKVVIILIITVFVLLPSFAKAESLNRSDGATNWPTVISDTSFFSSPYTLFLSTLFGGFSTFMPYGGFSPFMPYGGFSPFMLSGGLSPFMPYGGFSTLMPSPMYQSTPSELEIPDPYGYGTWIFKPSKIPAVGGGYWEYFPPETDETG